MLCGSVGFCFFKQKTAYEMRISDWSSDVCFSDLNAVVSVQRQGLERTRFARNAFMVEPAWHPQRALRRQQPTAVLHRDDDHPGQREENPPVARPRLRQRSLVGNVRSAAKTLKHFTRPLRSERLAKPSADGARRRQEDGAGRKDGDSK